MAPDPALTSLILRIVSRETAALSELHQHVSDILFAVVLEILKNHQEAEDALQEVFLKIWKNAFRYQDTLGSPVSWLITITRNTAYDHYRRRARQNLHQAKSEQDLTEMAYSEQPSRADDALLTTERKNNILQALNLLVPEQREAIELAFFSGHTQQEVSEKLGVPLGTIKARIRRGMLTLKPHLSSIV